MNGYKQNDVQFSINWRIDRSISLDIVNPVNISLLDRDAKQCWDTQYSSYWSTMIATKCCDITALLANHFGDKYYYLKRPTVSGSNYVIMLHLIGGLIKCNCYIIVMQILLR